MTCANCGAENTHIKITIAGETCPNCGGFSETSGVRIDNTLARNSFRVREQQQQYEGDMLPPHRYNRETRRAEPDLEFIKRFPHTAKNHYTPEELKSAGMPKLAEKVKVEQANRNKPDPDVKFRGDTKEGIKKAIQNA